ncbi:aldo/keto reductase [Mesorhizobium sp. RP14(2022)]|uniref:Aldo/keto reductase n=1 Tax=Mesorhizobium liriopis TaxID=2953882 RepID=A0ABT1C0N0_9HYPH|nr:aldo/keto reductase [Mesorhizobium liriopis]MCO6048390.1 aldo/keto reductase [Mesorhizobium liriopis]
MKTRRVGRTDLHVTEYSFGTAPLGNMFQVVSREQGMDALEAAWEGGMRYFDTAPHYGFGLAERRVGDFLRGKPKDEWVLSTKVGRLLSPVPEDQVPQVGFVDPLPFKLTYDYSYDAIMRSVEFSYARLGLNRIDILYVHDIGSYTHGPEKTEEHLRQLIEGGGIRALEELKKAGTIHAFGLGVNETQICLDVMARADIDCILLAGRYTLLDRTAEDKLLPLCREKGTSLVIGGVFNSGILATGPVPGAHFDYGEAPNDVREKVGQMEEVAKSGGYALPAAALQFPLHSEEVATVLVGSSKRSSLERNFKLLETPIPDSEWAKYDALTVKQVLPDRAVRE